MRVITTICTLLVVMPGICLSDESFRCGSWLVSADMSVEELLNKCGKPTSQEVSTHDVRNLYGAKVGTSTAEIWRYDRGSRAAPMIVTIVDGQIQSIERAK
jgi:Protein of unknown function (DUF2845)